MYSYSHPTALVIGAGLGGIVTAARLARAGFSVKVLEKQEAPGGRCSQLIRDGHRFDIGATLFLMPEVFAETYTALGERMEDHLELHRIDPTYRIRFGDDTQIALTSNLNSMEQQLEAIEPGSFGGLLRYLVEGYDAYHLSLQRFVGRNFYHFSEYFSLQNLPLLFKLKALVKHYDNIGHYFHDPHLKAAFYIPEHVPGTEPVRCTGNLFSGAIYGTGRRGMVPDRRHLPCHRKSGKSCRGLRSRLYVQHTGETDRSCRNRATGSLVTRWLSPECRCDCCQCGSTVRLLPFAA